jgi:hypothetical protein
MVVISLILYDIMIRRENKIPLYFLVITNNSRELPVFPPVLGTIIDKLIDYLVVYILLKNVSLI